MNNTDIFQNTIEEIRPGLRRLQTLAFIMLAVGVVCSALGFLVEGKDTFFHAWLTSYLFWFGLTAGCIALLVLHHTTGGGWGFTVRRMCEAGSRCLWLIALLFVPIIFGAQAIFEWAHPAALHDAVLREKAAYLNLPFFVGRALFYFVVLGIWTYFLNKWSAVFDERSDQRLFGNLNRLGASGIVVYCLLITFMSVDWAMSITPHWVSSVFGLLFVVGQALTALALMNLFVGTLGVQTTLLKFVPQRYFRDLGNLMMAMVLAWSYLSFSQYLIQYSGNIAEEVEWYVVRRHGGWGLIGLALVFLHFVLPFAVLLSSSMKTNPRNLWKIAAFILFMRWIDMLYISRPNLDPNFLSALHLADVGTFCLMGGAWLWLWGVEVQKRPLVPRYDPRFSYNWEIHEHDRAHGDHLEEEQEADVTPSPHVPPLHSNAEVTG
jgi:hypothetical protein